MICRLGCLKRRRPPLRPGISPGCVGTYERLLDIPREWEGERVFLAFDGVYMHATVSLNGSRIDFHPYGYSPFCVEITRRVLFGRPNRLEVVADSSEAPNCRWYAGAGIYRDVKLLHGPLVRIQHRGIFLQTESIDGDTATVAAQVQVVNDTALPLPRPCGFDPCRPGRGGDPRQDLPVGGAWRGGPCPPAVCGGKGPGVGSGHPLSLHGPRPR